MMMMMINKIIIIITNLWTEVYEICCVLYTTSAFRLHAKVIQSDKPYYLR